MQNQKEVTAALTIGSLMAGLKKSGRKIRRKVSGIFSVAGTEYRETSAGARRRFPKPDSRRDRHRKMAAIRRLPKYLQAFAMERDGIKDLLPPGKRTSRNLKA